MAAKPLEALFAAFRRQSVAPTKSIGAPGVATYGGFVQTNEKNPDISSHDARYRTYSDILSNTSIVAAGVRYFLNLTAKAEWTFTPSEADKDGKYAELAEEILRADPETSWHRVVRRAAMYRFYGFSIQEWTAMRRKDGVITLMDIAPRAQSTIERWDLDTSGRVLGAIQVSPQTQQSIYLPRKKILYLVDDSLNDSPEGLGLFRHLVEPAARLRRYEQLEGFGFETDLRGIPMGRAPFEELNAKVKSGELSAAEKDTMLNGITSFMRGHIKSPKLGLLLDSIAYETKDEAGRPSSIPKYSMELLKGSASSFTENANAIERLNRELARVLGVEQLLLGSSSSGSFALSRDKTSSFFLLVDGGLKEIKEAVEKDLLEQVWKLNGWDAELMPEVDTEEVRFTEAEQVAAALRDMASAGAVLDERDPVVDEVRALLGVSPRPVEILEEIEEDAQISRELKEEALANGQLLPDGQISPEVSNGESNDEELPDDEDEKSSDQDIEEQDDEDEDEKNKGSKK